MKKPLNEQLADLINRYLQVRRSFGYIHKNAEYILNEFERYLSQYCYVPGNRYHFIPR